MTDEQTADLIVLVSTYGTPTAGRALAALLNELAERRRADADEEERVELAALPAGRTVLACRCGRVLDLAEMRRLPCSTGDRILVRPIVCIVCAIHRAAANAPAS